MTLNSIRSGLLLTAMVAGLSVASSAFANYQLDDGRTPFIEESLPGAGVAVIQYTAVAGMETLTGLEIYFGPSNMEQSTVTLSVFKDMDGNSLTFGDAQLIYSEAVTATPGQLNSFNFLSGATLSVGEVFYVGVSFTSDVSIYLNRNNTGGTSSWYILPNDEIRTLADEGRSQDFIIRAVTTPVPEPASIAAVAGGLILAGALVRRRRKA